MRHPQAMAQGPGGSGDTGRPLSALGRHQAQRVGLWLRSRAEVPIRIIHSPALRCTEAARLVAQGAELPGSVLVSEEVLYSCAPADIERLVEASAVGPVMVIGHNPTLAALIEDAVGRDTFDDGRPVHVPPGYVAHLRATQRPVTFAPGVCEVVEQRMPETEIGA